MSLVNDMLKDLDRRQAPELNPAPVASGYGHLTQQKNKTPWLLISLMVLALLLAIAIAGLWHFKDQLLPLVGAAQAEMEATSDSDGAINRSDNVQEKTTMDVAAKSPEPIAVEGEHSPLPSMDMSVEKSANSTPAEDDIPLRGGEVVVVEEVIAEKAAVDELTTDKIIVEDTVSRNDVASESVNSATENNSSPYIVAESDLLQPSIEPRHNTIAPAKTLAAPVAEKNSSQKLVPIKKHIKKTPKQKDEEVVSQASRLMKTGQGSSGLDAAERLLDSYIKVASYHDKSSELFTLVLLQRGKVAMAIDRLKHFPVADPYLNAQLHARLLQAQGDFTGAITLLEQELPAIGDSPDHHAMLAAMYQQQGRYPDAAAFYAGLISFDDSVGNWWAGLGLALEGSVQMDAAKRAYQRALMLSSLNAELATYIAGRLDNLK